MQEKIKAACVLVVGAGGLGTTMLPLLAASGVGKIILFDHDRVERSNLGRQWLFRESDIGAYKATTVKNFLTALNPYTTVMARTEKFTQQHADVLRESTIALEGSDSLSTKFLINDLAKRHQRPALIAALGAQQGHAMFVGEGACYRCLFDEVDSGDLPTCASEGILSTFPSVVGSAVAHTALEFLLTGDGASKFWIFEKNTCRKILIPQNKDCQQHIYDT